MGGRTLHGDVGYSVTGGSRAINPGSNERYPFDPLTGEHGFIGSFEDMILGSGFPGLSIVPEATTLTLAGLAG